jgi:succinate dehydrogenase/fumarate reductase flavoprotein subunit
MEWFKKKRRWDLEVDVVVLGTGAAGMTAALAAHEGGAKVALLEKAALVGGTTAVSGGVVWVPNNRHLAEVGIRDSRDEALKYITRLTDGRSRDDLVERFVDAAPEMLDWVEAQTTLRFAALAKYPDYHPEFEGGKPGGRSLDPGLFDSNELGAWKPKLRRSPIFGMTAMSVAEATEWGVFSKPLKLPFKLLGERYSKGFVCYGGALAGKLLKALLDRRVEPLLRHAARELLVEEGRVVGVRAEADGADGRDVFVSARRGVILASGGFEWDRDLAARFLGGVLTHPNSPPTNEGDGLRMAMSVGADLGNMSEAWWCPSVVIPGEEYEGRPLHRGDFATRSMPHTIIVNRGGRRFVNEAQNYNDMMKAFFAFEPNAYERPNLPAWLVFDHAYLEKYALLTVMPGQATPEWLERADTLDELARKVGIDAHELARTLERFNAFAVEGADRDFHRGESLYDRFYGDPDHAPNPNLGTIAKKPFYALRVHPGAIGTKGGARVDANAQVLRADGTRVPGLYAAGNVMAGVMGAGYPGAGATIAAAMTFGFLAGRHAAAGDGNGNGKRE